MTEAVFVGRGLTKTYRSGEVEVHAVHVEFLGRNRLEVDIPVVDIILSYVSLMAFMDIKALNQLLGESPSISGIHMLLDPAQSAAFFAKVREQPALSALTLQRGSLAKFQETIA